MGSTCRISPVFSAFLLIVLEALAVGATTRPDGFRGSLIHKKVITVDGAHPLHAGGRWLADVTATTLKRAELYYVMKLAVGTPPVTVQAIVTGSDLCWVECAPCSGCGGSTPAAAARLYRRANSSSFSPLPCSSQPCKALPEPVRTTCTDTQCGYRYVYSGGGNGTDSNYVQGTLGTETFRFGRSSEVAVQGFAFGCTDTVYRDDLFDGNTGVIGLGRSKLSLVDQLGLDRFSYCLSSNTKVASPILFGSKATITGSAAVLSTPLLYDYVDYYVNLLGISVDGKRLPIPNGTFVLDTETGRGGVYFDTSSPNTLLVEPAYTLVVQALRKAMSPAYKAVNVNGSTTTSQLCYRVDEKSGNPTVPAMTMHFEGMDLKLSWRNYFAFDSRQSDLLCSVIGKSTTDSVIGNFMQMDFHVLFDLKKSVLSLQRADCSKI